MAYYTTTSRQEIFFSRKSPGHVSDKNFLISFACAFDRFNATVGRTVMQIFKFFGPFFHLDGNKNWEFNKDLKKLLQSHPKDVVIRNQLAKIFIDQCDFMGRIEA